MKTQKTDVLVIGSGLAGIMTAELLSVHKNVIIFTKNRLEDSNSYLAQGGIAAAIQSEDSWYDHFLDTLQAGCYHNEPEATQQLVEGGPDAIHRLVELGVRFDRNDDGTYQYGQEGAHNRARILHICGDATGKHLIDTVKRRVLSHGLVQEGQTVVRLMMSRGRCVGAWSIDQNGEWTATYASTVILATGGLSGLYPFNSNAETITGDGIALAYEAGAEISDLEFIQFHPTLLVTEGKSSGLVTEAVRGQGAKLVDQDGRSLMEGEHPLEDLAPRDVVSRVLYRARQSGKETFLDIRGITDFEKKFPTVTRLCRKGNIDLQEGFIPVSPGAHFTMGGIDVDRQGATTVPNLYAVGEVANTGVHGANRLASNSLLEGVVFACEVANSILSNMCSVPVERTVQWSDLPVLVQSPEFSSIQAVFNDHIGIERNRIGLEKAVRWFEGHLTNTVYQEFPNLQDIQMYQHVLVGALVARSALERTESRGSHYRTDHPIEKEYWRQKRIKRRKRAYEPVESTARP